jgi:hypothetical protein
LLGLKEAEAIAADGSIFASDVGRSFQSKFGKS